MLCEATQTYLPAKHKGWAAQLGNLAMPVLLLHDVEMQTSDLLEGCLRGCYKLLR